MNDNQDPENFADAPINIDEIRAARTNSSADISPRSMIVEVLRAIDRGELNPEFAVVITAHVAEDGETFVKLHNATPNAFVMLGLIEEARYNYLRQTE